MSRADESASVLLAEAMSLQGRAADKLRLAIERAQRQQAIVPHRACEPPSDLVEVAERMIAIRTARAEAFKMPGLFADPAYDMLLELYVAHSRRSGLTTTALCGKARVPPSTALSWVGVLVAKGWASKSASSKDRRLVTISLTEKAVAAVETLLVAVVKEMALPEVIWEGRQMAIGQRAQ